MVCNSLHFLIISDSCVEVSWIDRVNLSDEGDPDMEVKRSIKVFLLLSESSLDLLPVKSDMAEVISRQDWTARISEERASSRNEISARLPEVDLGTHLLDRILRRLLVFLDVLALAAEADLRHHFRAPTVAIQLLTSLSKIAEFALLMSRHPLPSRMSCDQKSEQIFLFILLEVSVERHLN